MHLPGKTKGLLALHRNNRGQEVFRIIVLLMSQLKHHAGDIYKTWKSLVNSVVCQQSRYLLFNSRAILIIALPGLPKPDLFQLLTEKNFPLLRTKTSLSERFGGLAYDLSFKETYRQLFTFWMSWKLL